MDETTRVQVWLEHPAILPVQVVSVPFERLILRLVPSRSHRLMVELLGNRASYASIMNWRLGRRRAPRWAWETLAVRLGAIYERDAELLALARNPPSVAPGQGSHRNICKWNQRRYAAKPVEPPSK